MDLYQALNVPPCTLPPPEVIPELSTQDFELVQDPSASARRRQRARSAPLSLQKHLDGTFAHIREEQIAEWKAGNTECTYVFLEPGAKRAVMNSLRCKNAPDRWYACFEVKGLRYIVFGKDGCDTAVVMHFDNHPLSTMYSIVERTPGSNSFEFESLAVSNRLPHDVPVGYEEVFDRFYPDKAVGGL